MTVSEMAAILNKLVAEGQGEAEVIVNVFGQHSAVEEVEDISMDGHQRVGIYPVTR